MKENGAVNSIYITVVSSPPGPYRTELSDTADLVVIGAFAGRRAGVATPLHDCMTALVGGLEESWDG